MLRSFTDVCDAVSVVEVGLRFLGKTGGDPGARLLSYLTDSLQMGPQVSSTVAKVESKPAAASFKRDSVTVCLTFDLLVVCLVQYV